MHIFGNILQALAVKPVGAVTATTNHTSVDTQGLEGQIALVLDSAAGTGTSPTLAITLEHSDDNSTFVAVPVGSIQGGAFTQVTNAAVSRQTRVVNKNDLKRYVRAVSTVGGTTPSFNYSLQGLGFNKYRS